MSNEEANALMQVRRSAGHRSRGAPVEAPRIPPSVSEPDATRGHRECSRTESRGSRDTTAEPLSRHHECPPGTVARVFYTGAPARSTGPMSLTLQIV